MKCAAIYYLLQNTIPFELYVVGNILDDGILKFALENKILSCKDSPHFINTKEWYEK